MFMKQFESVIFRFSNFFLSFRCILASVHAVLLGALFTDSLKSVSTVKISIG